ncbi:MAG: hypothetical protein E7305_03805 [Butyrivibrio sp.]|nr:hypothetical protein [Butyrivibrio sp.]
MKSKIPGFLAILITIASLFGISFLLSELIVNNGLYPSGQDAYYHLFRGDMLYKSIVRDNYYPLYNSMWYNGIQPLRYIAPLSAVLLALCEMYSGGQIFIAYVYYCVLIFSLGQLIWTIIGFKKKRPLTGTVFGIIYFFLPVNIYVLFSQGNLAMALCVLFVPLFLFAVSEYLESGRVRDLVAIIIVSCLMILSHTGTALLHFLLVCIYMLLQRFFFRNRRRMLKAFLSMIISFIICGIYTVPMLIGGYDFEKLDKAGNYFQSILITLNPVYRLTAPETAYFGLSLLIIAILGIMVSNHKSAPMFIGAVVTVLLTGTTSYLMIRIIPGAEMLWMLMLLPGGVCLVLLGVMYWDKLRKWILALFVVIILIDAVPSLYWIYGNGGAKQPGQRIVELSENTLIKEAKEQTAQRAAFIDLGELSGEGVFALCNGPDGAAEVFGQKYESAVTRDNTRRLNMALSDEYYNYLFDRCITLGADTVIIDKEQVSYGEKSLVKLDKAAERCNYDFLYENSRYMLYHLAGIDSYFGTKTSYDAIGIGYSAYSLSLAFPNIKETSDEYLDHYSYEELSKYKTIYLSGFYYDNRIAAENLVKKLSENGVRIVILADGMPEDRDTRTKTFLGVTCNVVQFENGYPILYTEDFGEMDCDLFPRGYSKWITYYLNGLKEVKGTVYDNNIELAFFGSGINENVCYIGLNIPFYYYITRDSRAEKIMQWVMGMEPNVLPEKEIYPIEISSFLNGLMINSPVDELNTGLAFQDIFRSDSQISEDNNLLVVNSGNTIIRLVYPYLMEGIIVTAIGVILCMIFLIYCMTSEIRDREKKEETDSEDETEEQPEPDNEGDEAVSEKENAGKETASDELQKHKYDLKSFDIDLTSGDDFDIPFGHKGKK